MKVVMSKKDLYAALDSYIKKNYGKSFNVETIHFSNGERYIPVNSIDVTIKK